MNICLIYILKCCSKKLNPARRIGYIMKIAQKKFPMKNRVSSLGRVQLTIGLINKGLFNVEYYWVGCVYKYLFGGICILPSKEYVNKASNLQWCTLKENTQYAICTGLYLPNVELGITQKNLNRLIAY